MPFDFVGSFCTLPSLRGTAGSGLIRQSNRHLSPNFNWPGNNRKNKNMIGNSRVHIALISFLSVLIAGCASINNKESSRTWDPAQDSSLAGQTPEPLRKTSLPYPVGQKLFVDNATTSDSGVPCAGNSFLLRELNVVNLGVSNRDVPGSAALLSTMGYQVFNAADGVGQRFDCDALPVVIVPTVPDESLVVHVAGVNASESGATGDLTVRPLRPANTVDMDHLLVFYHAEQQAAVESLEYLLHNSIDVPSPQVYIETMVLEVSEEDSKELGISYESAIGGNSLLNLGASEVGEGDTAGFTRNTRTEDGVNIFTPGTGIEVKLRALVEEGRAEILSRPSVLALSNRQAVIQIVDVVQTPILESTVTQSGELIISSYEFEPLLLGITLNLRPRVSVDRNWVSLEIDATVEAEVDENSGTAFAPDANGGRIALAEKKGSASRKVRTFARIPDRTPIIIGGLVAGNMEQASSRVPVLGKLPFIGALFGATDNEIQKREVIIVLTPHIMAEDAIGIASNRPRDDVMARVSDLMLFNNSYRIQSADVFDMNFLLDDPQFRAYRRKALTLNEQNTALEPSHPARQLAEGHIPGEQALVAKMLFDIISNSANRVSATADQVFLPELAAGQNIQHTSLATLLDAAKFGEDPDAGIWLQFDEGHVRHQAVRLDSTESWPRIESRLQRSLPVNSTGLLIRDANDYERLLRSIAVDTVLRLNGGYRTLNVQNLNEGTVLKLGTPADYSNYDLSTRTAQIYNDSQYYFDVLQRELTSTYKALDTAEQDILK